MTLDTFQRRRGTAHRGETRWGSRSAYTGYDGVDDLSNSVLDLMKERRFDDSFAACRRLQQDLPDVVDGLERTALVYRAMGDHATAADYDRKTLDFVTRPSRHDDYEGVDYYRESNLRMKSRLQAGAEGDHAQTR